MTSLDDFIATATARTKAILDHMPPVPIAVCFTSERYQQLKQLCAYPANTPGDSFMGLTVYQPPGLLRSIVLYQDGTTQFLDQP